MCSQCRPRPPSWEEEQNLEEAVGGQQGGRRKGRAWQWEGLPLKPWAAWLLSEPVSI